MDKNYKRCSVCGGSGRVQELMIIVIPMYFWKECPRCQGTGKEKIKK